VVRLASLGISGGVATYGALISDTQFNIIRGADKVIFALDNDEAGRVASKAMLKKCIDMGTEAWFFNYGDSDVKDIGGMSLEEVVFGINGAQHMIKGIVGAL
jgi:DNA primase